MASPRPAQRWRYHLGGKSFAVSLLLGFPLCLCAVWFFTHIAEQRFAESMARRARERLVIYSGTLDSALNRFSYLSFVLASHPEVQRSVTRGDNIDAMNRYLEELNKTAKSMELFIINREGITIAASNWNNSESFVGHDYHYRPYFQNAMNVGHGQFFGVGATTGKPGFFFTKPIPDPDKAEDGGPHTPAGVAVTKVNLAMLQREWSDSGETVFITDEHGIIFLSSRDEWRYRATKPLSDEAGDALLYQRQYGNTLPDPIEVAAYKRGSLDLMDIGGETWMYTTRRFVEYGWTFWFLTPVTALEQETQVLWLIGGSAVCILLLLLLLARTVLAWSRARRGAMEAKRIQAVNRRLAQEIRIRKETEKELLAAQDDLLHASRMAALGQVAASVVHELSQPVTAMGMFAASCRRLAEEGRQDKVVQTIGHMTGLVDRIKVLIDQLRHFSRKAPGHTGMVPLKAAIANALTVLQFKQEEAACAVSVVCPDNTAVLADAMQLEQVLINLIHNALDAVGALEKSEERTVSIEAAVDTDMVTVSVTDNGPGIGPADRDHIFTPFFSTKKSGEGIGLGLAIVDNIVRSMRGEIRVADNLPRGTRFALRLRLAEHDGNTQ
ncbi:putative C4-dicarboxylate transport sensor protein DctB [uncultured delta proteobacterium]|uniref:histidine kinase n=1 Tax=uncultured delta proteobacterium TaxID=34034 RepID=A0A212JN35_9DELT|nr:putative C4-dicarboxylate transport sensor protein DctB [uncultured delta proteobacterium]